MPIYEYRCKKGHTFEVRANFTDGPVTECEVCGLPVERVFHPIAVHFKGSGFYNTDYGTRNRSREKEAKESSKSKSESSSSNNGKPESGSKSDSDSKPAKSESGKSESGSKKTDTSSAKSS
jgi:putative FmdB family regulatory protein